MVSLPRGCFTCKSSMSPVNKLLGKLLQGVVIFYQRYLRAIFHALGGPHAGCRFEPSCSHYSLQALQQHGPWYGAWLTLRRLLRCHPFGGFGYDPVPPAGKRQQAAAAKPQSAGKHDACCAHNPTPHNSH